MHLREIRDMMVKELRSLYPESECYSLVNELLFSLAGIEKKEIALDPGRQMGKSTESLLFRGLQELLLHKPVQYITGKAYFYDLELAVNPFVLIPRPETEELVKWAADDHKEKSGLKVLDIGTGSGCIILALGRLLKGSHLTAMDISESAIGIAAGNALKYDIRVEFKKTDILDENQWIEAEIFDLIISNPPYVTKSEESRMQANVLEYEPHEALFVPSDDPLLFYKAIAGFSKKHLSANGKLYLEINENLGKEVMFLLKEEGFSEIILKKDMQGKDRMIRCNLPSDGS